MEIKKHKEVWIVSTNTDNTEGRGYWYPIHVCEKEATAIRLSKRKGIMGSDAPVYKGVAVMIGATWLSEVRIEQATTADDAMQAYIDAREAALIKAKSAGMTDDEIALLGAKP